jgi:hypothetical protein
MEILKPVVGKDYSINRDATITKPDGTTVSASSVFCTAFPIIIEGLKAAEALTKNFIVKMCIGIVLSAVEALGTALCGAAQK